MGSIILGILTESWHLLDEAALYVLFGLVISGLIQASIRPEGVARHLGPQRFRSVLLAALFGVPLPLCSCGVIPTAISLRRQGASKGATLSFLISTPESGVDSIAVSFALLDPLMTFFRPVGAFFTGLVAGIAENLFPDYRETVLEGEGKDSCVYCADEDCNEDHDHNTDHNHSWVFRLTRGVRYAFVELLGDIGLWLLGGVLIAGVISYFVPESLVTSYLGYGWTPMLVMLVVGIPLYICATASTPIAAALLVKGLSPGAAFVFLLCGPATNAATIMMVTRFLGKRAAAVYLVSIAACALLLGWLLNQIYLWTGMEIRANLGTGAELVPHGWKVASAVVLLGFIINAVARQRKEHKETKER
jgi:uncharacterized membrane protein YraQ (UPF0718 family)